MRRCLGRIIPKIWLLPAAQVPLIPSFDGPLRPCASDALCRGQEDCKFHLLVVRCARVPAMP